MKPQSQGEKVHIARVPKGASEVPDFRKMVENAFSACAIDGDDAYRWGRMVGKAGAKMMDFVNSGPGEKQRLDHKLKLALYDKVGSSTPLGKHLSDREHR